MQAYNTISWNIICEFWIRGFIVELWRDLLTSRQLVASNPESSIEQIPTTCSLSTWLFNLYNKLDGDLTENPENEIAN